MEAFDDINDVAVVESMISSELAGIGDSFVVL
jgi:hypothetical protein